MLKKIPGLEMSESDGTKIDEWLCGNHHVDISQELDRAMGDVDKLRKMCEQHGPISIKPINSGDRQWMRDLIFHKLIVRTNESMEIIRVILHDRDALEAIYRDIADSSNPIQSSPLIRGASDEEQEVMPTPEELKRIASIPDPLTKEDRDNGNIGLVVGGSIRSDGATAIAADGDWYIQPGNEDSIFVRPGTVSDYTEVAPDSMLVAIECFAVGGAVGPRKDRIMAAFLRKRRWIMAREGLWNRGPGFGNLPTKLAYAQQAEVDAQPFSFMLAALLENPRIPSANTLHTKNQNPPAETELVSHSPPV